MSEQKLACSTILKSDKTGSFRDSFPEKNLKRRSCWLQTSPNKVCFTQFKNPVLSQFYTTHLILLCLPVIISCFSFNLPEVLYGAKPQKKKGDETEYCEKNNRNIGLRVHWPCEQAFSLLRFVHKPYFLHKRLARGSDTVPARFQSVLMLQDNWQRTRHCWVRIRNWNREQTDVVKRKAQS